MADATMPTVSRFRLDRTVPLEPDAVFTHLTDPVRMPRWLPWTERIEAPSGPLDVAGTTFSQRAATGIRRPGGVVSVDPPRSWHLRLAGGGERVDLEFVLTPRGDDTHIGLTADVRNGPGAFGRVVDLVAGRLDRRSWDAALDRLVADLLRTPAEVATGDLVSLDGGGGVRVAQVIGADDQAVHLRLFGGRRPTRPAELDVASLELSRPRDHHAIHPLIPSLRSAAFSPSRVVAGLLADGGLGVAHLPMTRRAFDDAEPQRAGHAALPPDAAAAIEAWRDAGGAAFGSEREPLVGALFSVSLQAMGIDGLGFGIVKLLRQQFRGVHVRVYSNTFVERPERIGEAELESRPIPTDASGDRPPTAPLAIGHVPLGHATFQAWQPVFVATALVQPDELVGYEMWKFEKGGFF